MATKFLGSHYYSDLYYLNLNTRKEVDVYVKPITNKDDKISSTEICKVIEELSKLKDKGILTEEEFNSKKQDLLSQI